MLVNGVISRVSIKKYICTYIYIYICFFLFFWGGGYGQLQRHMELTLDLQALPPRLPPALCSQGIFTSTSEISRLLCFLWKVLKLLGFFSLGFGVCSFASRSLRPMKLQLLVLPFQ